MSEYFLFEKVRKFFKYLFFLNYLIRSLIAKFKECNMKKSLLAMVVMFGAINLFSQELSVVNVSPGSSTIQAGQDIDLDLNISNQSTIAAGSYSIGYYLSDDLILGQAQTPPPPGSGIQPYPDDLHLGTQIIFSGIGARDVDFIQSLAGIKIPTSVSSGSYYLFVWVDNAEDFSESNEVNNVYRVPVTITGLPDLEFSSFTILSESLVPWVPKTFERGKSVPMACVVKNDDPDATPSSSRLGYYLSTNNTLDAVDTYIDYRTISALSGGATQNIHENVLIPANTVPGNYWIFASIDNLEQVTEFDESNNILGFEIIVTLNSGLFDFDITTINIDQSTITEGDNLTADVTIKNIGTGVAPSGAGLEVFLSEDTDFDGPLTDLPVLNSTYILNQSLGVNQSFVVNNLNLSLPFEFTTSSKNWTLIFRLNLSLNNFSETNLNNNEENKTIFVNNYSGGGIAGEHSSVRLESELTKDILKVYPNPSDDILRVVLPKKANYVIQIVNSRGAVNLESRISKRDSYALDVSSVDPGIYFLKITSETGYSENRKIIIR